MRRAAADEVLRVNEEGRKDADIHSHFVQRPSERQTPHICSYTRYLILLKSALRAQNIISKCFILRGAPNGLSNG